MTRIEFLRAKRRAALVAELGGEMACSRCAPGATAKQGLCAKHARRLEAELRDRREWEAAVSAGTFAGCYAEWKDAI